MNCAVKGKRFLYFVFKGFLSSWFVFNLGINSGDHFEIDLVFPDA